MRIWSSLENEGHTEMTDTTHLVALFTRLANETARLNAATSAKETEFRASVVRSCKKEINGEEKFLGMTLTDWNAPEISDEELMAELGL